MDAEAKGMSDKERAFVSGACAGFAVAIVAALVIWGFEAVGAFLVGGLKKGFEFGYSFIPTVVAAIMTVTVFGGVAMLLGAIAVVVIANVIGKLLENFKLAQPESVGKAIQATVQRAKQPETWYIIFSGVFVALMETTKEFNDAESAVKLLLLIFLLATVVFTYCFTRRKKGRPYLIAAFAAPALFLLMYGWTLFDIDPQHHIVFSESARSLAGVIKKLSSEPDRVLLLILPALIGVSSFLSIMLETKPELSEAR